MDKTGMSDPNDVKWYNPLTWILWFLHWLFIGTDPNEL